MLFIIDWSWEVEGYNLPHKESPGGHWSFFKSTCLGEHILIWRLYWGIRQGYSASGFLLTIFVKPYQILSNPIKYFILIVSS